MVFRHLDFYHSPDLIFVISTLRTNLDANSCHLNLLQREIWISAISTLRAIQIKIQIQIKNSGSRSDEGIEVRIFGSHFLGKFISEEFWPFDLGVTSWHWFPDCQHFLGRSYPSGCIGHRPLVSSALRSYGDRCMPRVPSNPAACFPPSISISWLNYYVLAFGFIFWAFFVLGLWNTQFAYSAFIHSAATILADLKS